MTALGLERLPYDPDQVTPGVEGFVVTAIVAIAVMVLLFNFNRRVRRINDRADIRARIDAEVAERDALERAAAEGQPDAVEEAAARHAGIAEGGPAGPHGSLDAAPQGDAPAIEAEPVERERRGDA